MFSSIIKKYLVFTKDGQFIKLTLRCEDQDTASRPLLNVNNKHCTSQCYRSRPLSAERGAMEGGNLARRGLGLRNRYAAAEGVHRGEFLFVCFALIKFHSIFLIHNFLQKFCILPFYYVGEVSVCGTLNADAHSHRDQKHRLTWQLELQAVGSLPAWVLGTKLRFSRKALNVLHCWAISIALNKQTPLGVTWKDRQPMTTGHSNSVFLSLQTRRVSDLRGPFPTLNSLEFWRCSTGLTIDAKKVNPCMWSQYRSRHRKGEREREREGGREAHHPMVSPGNYTIVLVPQPQWIFLLEKLELISRTMRKIPQVHVFHKPCYSSKRFSM